MKARKMWTVRIIDGKDVYCVAMQSEKKEAELINKVWHNNKGTVVRTLFYGRI